MERSLQPPIPLQYASPAGWCRDPPPQGANFRSDGEFDSPGDDLSRHLTSFGPCYLRQDETLLQLVLSSFFTSPLLSFLRIASRPCLQRNRISFISSGLPQIFPSLVEERVFLDGKLLPRWRSGVRVIRRFCPLARSALNCAFSCASDAGLTRIPGMLTTAHMRSRGKP